ncbi:maleylpyruvate isomerase family mycothiol-dependent enzyme [Antrihabitans cavernicola]|uniref:Maleylpyruvate isomerase family mycothiol-dependent enzyme n=1 Tax=Antrihabitans cavernicola TaxID=2495913 RepID=A0A5A7SD64_9NOCA|nr:maleylpyruvate isomerase family mycothiol-dependent enzyme [Spelaeibacter cavernicola]KAA0022435.1 maleylpyruvate isomerase family mycothiol-dependent enzyme [Spelaeibacter cavernicola]
MTSKAEITTALFDEWTAIDDVLSALDDNQWRLPTPLPGWDVHAVVAHMIGTESLMRGDQLPTVDVDVRARPHVKNELAAMNELWVESLRPLTGTEMLARFREVTALRRTDLTDMSDDDWNAPTPSPIGDVPYGRFMRVRLFDCWMHEHDIRDAVGIPGDEGGARGRLAFQDIADAIPRVFAKRGKAPEGSRIAVALSGPLPENLNVAVDDRAALVDSFDGLATTTIRMDSGVFTRLAGGRTSVDAHKDDIEIEGDRAVGQRIVDNLAFVF